MAIAGAKIDTGTIKLATGEVKIKGVDGVERLAVVGDQVHAGETVVTGANGIVAIQLGNRTLDLGRDSSMTLSPDLMAMAAEPLPGAPMDEAAAAAAAAARVAQEAKDEKIAELKQRIANGDVDAINELNKLEGTAAGGQPGQGQGGPDGNEGHSFVVLGQADGHGPVTAGFNTLPASIAFGLPVEQLLPVPAPVVSVEVQIHIPTPPGNPPANPPSGDLPLARNDTDFIAEGAKVTNGNVITGVGTTSGLAGADFIIQGAQVTGVTGTPVSDTNGAITVHGNFGTLTINPNGQYLYTRDPGAPDGVTETFTYTLTDKIGDTTKANLVIDVGSTPSNPPPPDTPPTYEDVVISGNSASLIEGTGGPDRPVNFVISLDHTYTQDVTVTYTIVPAAVNGAQDPADFTGPLTGTVTIPTGQLTFIVPISIVPDHLVEPNESFSIVLSNPVNATLNPNATAAFVTIIDDDMPPHAMDDTYAVARGHSNGLDSVLTHLDPGETEDDSGAGPGEGLTVVNPDGTLITNPNGLTITTTQGGIVLMHPDGTFTYTPPAVLHGSDTFTYSMTDTVDGQPIGNGTSTAKVTLVPDNEPPTVHFDLSPGDGTVNEAGLSFGSNPASNSEFTQGKFTIDDPDGLQDVVSVTINGTTIPIDHLAGSVITTPLGVMTITGYDTNTGVATFTYGLAKNELNTPAANDGTNVVNGAETFTVTVQDSDAHNSAPAQLPIQIIDDVPTAVADANTVNSGATVGANVEVNDTFGADGKAAAGGVVGVIDAAHYTAGSSLSTGVGAVINGTLGTLTLGADGSYTYKANPNVSSGTDTFVYTIQDGDGDTSTTTLAIDVAKVGPGLATGTVQVDEAGLANGSDPTSGADVGLGTLGLPAGITVATAGDMTGQFGTLHVNTDGTFTYTLTKNDLTTPAANDGTNVIKGADTFTVTTTDTNGNTNTATITVDIKDDVPTLAVSGVNEAGISLQTTDALVGAADTASASFAAAFVAAVAPTFGADGTAAVNGLVVNNYSLSVSDTNSGLTSHGVAITLSKDPVTGDVIGKAGATEVFSLHADAASGVVTLTQLAAVDHAAPGAAGSATMTNTLDTLGNGKVSLGATATVTDSDGDTAVKPVTADLGGVVSFKDDVPTLTVSAVNENGISLQTTDALVGSTDTASASFASAFVAAVTPAFGGDGAAAASSVVVSGYNLSVTDTNSGLTSHGVAITLSTNAAGDVVGMAGATEVFSLHADAASGQVTLTQFAAVDHAAPGAAGSATMTNTLDTLANGKVSLGATATVTDFDGDTASKPVAADLGGVVSFKDDVPTLTVSAVNENGISLQTTDALVGHTDTSSASFAAAFVAAVTPAFGGDGAAAANSVVVSGYNLAVTDTNSGLTSHGVAITLSKNAAGDVVGMAGATEVFSLHANAASGVVTLSQFAAVDHAAPGAAGSATMTNTLDTLANGKISLGATATVTDFDGDTASKPVTADLGGVVSFKDDVPTLTVSAVNENGISLQTTDASVGPADTASASFASAFVAAVTPAFGGDGAAATNSVVVSGYSLSVSDINSGLTSHGVAITLSTNAAGDVVGMAGATEVFSLHANAASGQVTLTQFAAVDHAAPGAAGSATMTNTLDTLANGKISLGATATVTDFDGDTATKPVTADLGGVVSFKDDVPTLTVSAVNENGISLQTTDASVGPADTSSASFAAAFVAAVTPAFGGDGAAAANNVVVNNYSLSVTTANSGLTSHGVAITLSKDPVTGDVIGKAGATEVFSLHADAASGQVTLTQFAAVDHAAPGAAGSATMTNTLDTLANGKISLGATATVTDFDGDTASKPVTADLGGAVSFRDDVPTLTVSAVNENGISLQTTDASVGPADASSASFAAAFVAAVTPAFGGDGAAAANSVVVNNYSLSVTDAASGLTSHGVAITLSVNAAGDVVGMAGATEVFSLHADAASGQVTLTQFAAVDHAAPGAAGSATMTNTLDTLANGKISLGATATVTDFDGDTASKPVTADLGGVVSFKDDVPTLTVSAVNENGISLQTTDATVGPADTASASFASAFVAAVTPAFGGDGAAAANSVVVNNYSLSVSDTNSGLTSHGVAITLSKNAAGDVVGMAGATEVFSLHADAASGVVTLTQLAALDHLAPGAAGNASITDVLDSLPNGKVSLSATATVTDFDGDTASKPVTADLGGVVSFRDDVPTAVADTTTVNSGAVASGNVETNDLFGADGKAAAGGVVGVIDAAHYTAGTSLSTGLNTVITGTLGTLTLQANGSYTYTANPNVSNGVDTFVYTIKDGDGDTSTTTLTIDVSKVGPGTAAGTVQVDEAGLANGSNPASNSEIGLGTLGLAAGTTVVAAVDLPGKFGTLHVNTDGTFTYTLTKNDLTTPAANDGTNVIKGAETFTVTVTDANHNTNTATITVDIKDDVPTLAVSGVNEAGISLQTSDAALGTAADTVTASFAAAFVAAVTPTFGADGTAAVNGLVVNNYSLSVSDTNSGLTSHGVAITLSKNAAGDVVGMAGATEVFSLHANAATGVVTLTQFAAVDHASPGAAGSATMTNTLDTLANGKVSLGATATVTDSDGDTASKPVTADLGGVVSFKDDVPTLTVSAVNENGISLQTSDAALGTAADIVTASFAAAFVAAVTPAFGGDGAAAANSVVVSGYSLSVTTANSGLTSHGVAITLSTNAAGDVVGMAGATQVFTLHADAASGQVTLTQFAAVDHAAPGAAGSATMTNTLDTLANGKISLGATATVTDFDGDTATKPVTADLGGVVSFKDDVPTLTVNAVNENGISLQTTDASVGPADTSSASFAAAFVAAVTPAFGGDGAAAANSVVVNGYNLSVTNAASGLTSHGVAITLSTNAAGDVVGMAGATQVFTLHADAASGQVTLTQFAAVDHAAPGAAGSATMTNTLDTLGNGKVSLGATATVTDFDGDTATKPVTADLGGVVSFKDDVPTLTVNAVNENGISLQTTDASVGPADTSSASFAAAFVAAVTPAFGGDGAAATNSVVVNGYNLSVTNAASGLTSHGVAITLSTNAAGDVVGMAGATKVFSLHADAASGQVTLTQFAAVDHAAPGAAGSATMTNTLDTLGNGKVSLGATATVTDFDGDTAVKPVTADLGGVVSFRDDVPTLTVGAVDTSGISLQTTDALVGSTDTASASFASAFAAAVTPAFGGDGAATANGLVINNYSLSVSNANSGLTSHGVAITLSTNAAGDVVGMAGNTEVFSLHVDATSGQVTQTQFAVLDHAAPGTAGSANVTNTLDSLPVGKVSLSATVTATDFDGDTATKPVSADLGNLVKFADDVPTAAAQVNTGQAQTSDTNLMIVLDVSGSMADMIGSTGLSRMDFAKASVIELLDQYQALGNVKVEIVTFSTTAQALFSTWTDVATAKAAVLGLTPNGNTNYDDALNTAVNAFNANGKITGAQNVSYFLSDGVPNSNTVSANHTQSNGFVDNVVKDANGNQLFGLSGTNSGGTNGFSSGITGTEITNWQNFVNNNEINSFSLGMGTGATQATLNPMAYNGVGAGTDTNAVVVSDVTQLASTLAATVHSSVTGNLETDNGSSVGKDGGHAQSVTVGGVTYNYDGTVAGGTSAGTYSAHGWTIQTTQGGTFVVHLDTGAYSYSGPTASTGVITEALSYVLVDNDGDTAANGLTIKIDPADTPAVVRDTLVITDQTNVVIPDWALLANNSVAAGVAQGISAVGSAASSDSVSHNATAATTTYNDTNNNGGSFNYTDTAGNTNTDSHVSNVTVNHETGTTIAGINSPGTATNQAYLNQILVGGSANETITGANGNDVLLGGGGNDTLNGGAGNDILVGGTGNDTLTGGLGNDTFKWVQGDQGTVGTPATDTIKDFGVASTSANGNDVLDLRDLLQGEHAAGAQANLNTFLSFAQTGNDVTLSIQSSGGATTFNSVDQKIVLTGVTMAQLAGNTDPTHVSTSADVINHLLAQQKLITD